MKKKKTIGLLGGIGPETTGDFYLVLISKFQEKGLIKSNRDFPQIIINSIPAPELIYEEISDKDLELYIRGLKELEKFGVDFIAMVCNTIYLSYEKLQKEIKTPIIDLRKEVRNFLTNKNIKSVTVLDTPTVIKKGLYKLKDINSIDLNDKEMRLLTDAIFNFNKGVNKEKQIEIVKSIAKKYFDKGSEFIISGCTELTLMLKDENIPKINTMDILLEAVIRESIK